MSDQTVSVGKTKGFTLPRAVDATIVPAGHQVMLAAGDRVTVLQTLVATATAKTADGEMARLTREESIDFVCIAAADGDAVPSDAPFSIDRVWDAATTVHDPQIPVDASRLSAVARLELG